MKILLINNFNYIRGGSDSVFFETAELLRNNRHEIALFTAKDENINRINQVIPNIQSYTTKDYFESDDISTLRKSWFFIKNKSAQDDLKNVIAQFKPDIVHLHIFQSRLSSFILKTIHAQNIPMVMTVHEYKMRCPTYLQLDNKGEICEKCSPLNYLPCITKKCVKGSFSKSVLMSLESYSRDFFVPYLRYIDKFIMVSKFLENKHLEYFPKYKNKFIQVYNFVDSQKYKANYTFGDYLLYFGRLSKEKGLLTLVKVAKLLPNILFKIVGSGEYGKELEKYAFENNSKNIEFIGFQSGNNLINLIKNARFTLVPSECYETLGMNIIESFCLETPVIGADIGGIPELIINNETGFLFKSKDKTDFRKVIEKAWMITPKEHKALSLKARQYAIKKFNKEKYYECIFNIYKSIKI